MTDAAVAATFNVCNIFFHTTVVSQESCSLLHCALQGLQAGPFSVPSTNNVFGYLIVRGEALSKSQVSYGQCSSRTWPRI